MITDVEGYYRAMKLRAYPWLYTVPVVGAGGGFAVHEYFLKDSNLPIDCVVGGVIGLIAGYILFRRAAYNVFEKYDRR